MSLGVVSSFGSCGFAFPDEINSLSRKFFHPETIVHENLQSIPFVLDFFFEDERFSLLWEWNRSLRLMDCFDSVAPRVEALRLSRPDFRPEFPFCADLTGVGFVLAIIDPKSDTMFQYFGDRTGFFSQKSPFSPSDLTNSTDFWGPFRIVSYFRSRGIFTLPQGGVRRAFLSLKGEVESGYSTSGEFHGN